ncbi:MAG: signal peptidase I [Bacilli bacterium]|nr:signal peptidase I [Bacilli bacterium]
MNKINKFIQPFYGILKIFSKFIFASFLLVFIFFILIISIYLLDNKLNVRTGKYNYPIYSAYIIISESMVPKIKINDAVINFRIENNKIKIGDVITFVSNSPVSNGITVTHRVIDIVKSSEDGDIAFRTKGDNNFSPDSSFVMEDDVIGKVMFIFPKIGYLQNFLSKNIIFVFFTIFICVFIIILDFFKYVTKKYIER